MTGSWSDTFNLDSWCIHATLLRGVGTNHSRIVWWPEPSEQDHSDGPHNTYSWNWTPTSGTSPVVNSFPVSTNLLCAGHSVLPNGELLITGGTELGDVGIRQITRLSVASSVWDSVASMQYPRWYPTNTSLGDGKVLISAGYKEPALLVFGGKSAAGFTNDLSLLRARHEVAWEDPEFSTTIVPGDRYYFSAADMGRGWDEVDGCTDDKNRFATLIYGGEGSTGLLSDLWGLVWNRDQDTYVWQGPLTPPGDAPGPLCRHSAVYDARGHAMYIYGGIRGINDVSDDLYRLKGIHPAGSDCTSDLEWELVSTVGPSPPRLYGHTAVFDEKHRRMIMFGGCDSTSDGPDRDYYSKVWLLDLKQEPPKWEGPLELDGILDPALVPERRMGAAVAWDTTPHNTATHSFDNNRLFVFGGLKGPNNALVPVSDTLWMGTIVERDTLNPNSTTKLLWRPLPPAYSETIGICELTQTGVRLNNAQTGRPSARGDAVMVLQGEPYNRILMYGGDTNGGAAGGEDGRVWKLDLGPFTCNFGYVRWDSLATSGPSHGARSGHVMVFDSRQRTALYPEVYDPSCAETTTLWSSKKWLYSYPFMHLLPDGKVFYSGPDTRTATLDLTTGWGSEITSGFSGDTSVLLPIPGGVQVMKCGQKVAPTGANSRKVHFIQFDNSNSSEWSEAIDNQLLEDRQDANLTILPDGRALLSGGVENAIRDTSSSYNPIGRRKPMIWDPVEKEWNTHAGNNLLALADCPRFRDYHSIALLLPDATVFTAGGQDTRGVYGAARRLTGEIYKPPYLFNGDADAVRPAIVELDEAVAYDSPFAVTVAGSTVVDRITMVRPGSVTHGFDQDQRFVAPTINSSSVVNGNRRVIVQGPESGNLAPPGDYLVFAFRDGVPSVGQWVRLQYGRSGVLAADESWSAADGPVVLAGDLTVPAGKSLTIQAGVRIVPSALTPCARLTIEGTLYVMGTSANRARLGGSTSSELATWQGVVVPEGGSVYIDYAEIRNAVIGIDVQGLLQKQIDIENTLFHRNSTYDIRMVRGATSQGCLVGISGIVDTVGAGTGVLLDGNFQNISFSGNTFLGSGGMGGSTSGAEVRNTGTSAPIIANSTFTGFLSGQGLKLGAGRAIVRGNTISNSKYCAYIDGGTHEFTPHLASQTANTFTGSTHSAVFIAGSGTDPKFRRNLIIDSYNGVVAKSGAKPDFGTATDQGQNSFIDYANKCLWNQSTGQGSTITAKGNYWDVVCPDSTDILTCMVNANFFPALCTSPLGAGRREIAVEAVVEEPARPLVSRSGTVVRSEATLVASATGGQDWLEFRVYDVLGRLRSLIPLSVRPGEQEEFTWRPTDRNGVRLASGLYFGMLRGVVAESQPLRLLVLSGGER